MKRFGYALRMLHGFNEKREIIGSVSGSETTLFVGLYNGASYIDKLIDQINGFSHNEVPVIFVDNASNDDTWDSIKKKSKALKRQYVLVRNPANIGGVGSLLTNLDLVKSEWITSVHQDDFYRENHLDVHLREINKASESCGVIATDMGVAIDDKNRGLIPRANWDFDPEDKVACFLGSLKSHLTPNPASSYRVEFLDNYGSPFYNAAFCDTEHELLAYSDWDFKWVPEITIDYMENPISESKSVDGIGREMAIVNSLCRVFTSDSFGHIASKVKEQDKEKFIEELIGSIQTRFDERVFAVLVINQALEELLKLWGPEPYVLKPIHAIKSALGQRVIESTLRSSLYFMGETPLYAGEVSTHDRAVHNSKIRSFIYLGIFKILGLMGRKNSKNLWLYVLKGSRRLGLLSQFKSPRFRDDEN